MTLSKDQIEYLLSEFYIVEPPEHIIILDKPAAHISHSGGLAVYSGLQPKWRKDLIILTPLADEETLFHEIIHTYGFGELGATVLGKFFAIRSRIRSRFYKMWPRELQIKFPRRQVTYERIDIPNLKQWLEQMHILVPHDANPVYFRLKKK